MTTRASYFVSPLAALVAFVASMAVLLLAYGVVPAQAAGSCSTTAGTTTCTFGPTGSEDTFTVPDWVSSVHVEATGAPGAGGFHFGAVSPAGRGATVRGDLTVTPGDTLYVNVGGAPTTDTGTCITDVACIGGFNGGGSSAYGGGGGGASDVRTVSSDQSGSLDSRLIVAGGSGEVWRCFDTSEPRPGGGGGDASSDGGDGTPCGSFAGGTGGEAGGQGAGGVGGSPDGGNGSLGLGGNGGISGSANGGGGGGGGALNYDSAAKDYVPAGGGGGGSNLVPTGGSASIAGGGPSITISYAAQNRPPVANDDPYTINEDTPLAANVLSNDYDPDGDALRVYLSSSNSNVKGALDLKQPDGSLEYTPPQDFYGIGVGSGDVRYAIADSNHANSGWAYVTIDVLPVNDAPSFTNGADQTVEANSGAKSVSGWATSIKDGPQNESAQTVTFSTSNDNNALFSAQPAVSPGGTLTFTPAANKIGSATVKVFAQDSGGTARGGVDTSAEQTFTITVRDTTAPSVSCSATPNKLRTSANNHKLVNIAASVNVTDGGSGPNGFKLISVTSNQADSGLGRDDVPEDFQGWTINTNDTTGQFRAERYGGPREYTLTYRGYDLAGNTTDCQAKVTVPREAK